MNTEEKRKYAREYYAKNRENIRSRNKKWRAENPDRVAQYLLNRSKKLMEQMEE